LDHGAGQLVTVQDGAFRSFNLSVKGSPTIYKVERRS